MRPWQNGRHFPDDIFKRVFLNEYVRIPIKNSQKFVTKGLINIDLDIGLAPTRRPIMVGLPTSICATWPQWFKGVYWIIVPRDIGLFHLDRTTDCWGFAAFNGHQLGSSECQRLNHWPKLDSSTNVVLESCWIRGGIYFTYGVNTLLIKSLQYRFCGGFRLIRAPDKWMPVGYKPRKTNYKCLRQSYCNTIV